MRNWGVGLGVQGAAADSGENSKNTTELEVGTQRTKRCACYKMLNEW